MVVVKGKGEVEKVLHMNAADANNSYANNSLLQKKVMLQAKTVLQESIAELCSKNFPDCLKMADMGCSSGPNALLPLWESIEAIDATCNRLQRQPPILQVFLNDLPGNDFNSIFTSLPAFYKKLEQQKGGKFRACFIAAVPGSFYGRLFPPNFLHFVHSSSTLHWLSQEPQGISLNKGNICLTPTSPPAVREAYLDQFRSDFSAFLQSRSEEMISGGHMVITCTAQSEDPHKFDGCELLRLIGNSVKGMVEEGMIEESSLDSCNLPIYAPSTKEMISLVESQGSFTIARLEEFEISWDANIGDGPKDKWERGKYVATYMRAATESILASYFGTHIIDDLFYRFSLKVADYLDDGTGFHNNLIVFMIKK